MTNANKVQAKMDRRATLTRLSKGYATGSNGDRRELTQERPMGGPALVRASFPNSAHNKNSLGTPKHVIPAPVRRLQ